MHMHAEGITQALMDNEESAAEPSSGVMAAFESFKTQQREHFSVSNHCRKMYTQLLRKVNRHYSSKKGLISI